MTITDQDDDEIIGIEFEDGIYFGEAARNKAISLQDFINLHSRATFKFMAVMDLSPKWEEYAGYPTIFKWSEYKKYEEKVTNDYK